MADARLSGILLHQALFVATAGFFVFVRLLPLGTEMRGGLVAPDLILALTLAYLLRRPDYVPVWLIASVFLVADLLLYRPPGLWTLLVVAATEILRDRQSFTRALSFPVEFGLVALVVTLLALGDWLTRIVFVLDNPGLGRILLMVPSMLICYPLMVLLVSGIYGVRRRRAPSAAAFGAVR